MKKILLIVIIQCDDATKRCSGLFCSQDFYARDGAFKNYPEDAQYMTMTCGGCCGNLLNAKIANLNLRLKKYNIQKSDVMFHLASCICSDNSHHQPCPFINRIAEIIKRKGYSDEQIKKGSHISKNAESKRNAGVYKSWDLN